MQQDAPYIVSGFPWILDDAKNLSWFYFKVNAQVLLKGIYILDCETKDYYYIIGSCISRIIMVFISHFNTERTEMVITMISVAKLITLRIYSERE